MDSESNVRLPGILPHHLAELRKRIERRHDCCGWHPKRNELQLACFNAELRKLPKKMAPALCFPYRGPGGSIICKRLKFDNPRKVGGKLVKYESPRGQPNEIYLPPGVAEVLTRADAELLITEGEKKALKATQEGFPCIGLVGVYGWKDGRSERLSLPLERVVWQGRQVRIVFDSDVSENPNIRDAESRFAKHVSDRGAKVLVGRLTPGPVAANGKPAKMGLDDFLVAHGPAALRKLLDGAIEPEPVGAAELKASASTLDPSDEGKAYLESTRRDDVYGLLYWRGTWWRWKRGAYRECEASYVRAALIRRLDSDYHHLAMAITSNVLDHVKAHCFLPSDREPPTWIEKRPTDLRADEILATPSKLVHLPSLVTGLDCTVDATQRFFTTLALDYDFDPSSPAPTAWFAFLRQLWPDDAESISTLQEWFGYLLTCDTRLQKILLLVGPKRSGKGTISRVLRELVGPGNVAGPTLAGLATNFGLWPLLGKSVAIVNDARLGHRSDQAIVVERLLSISGEDALTIDRKNLTPVTCKLSTRLMLLTNELPRLSDARQCIGTRTIAYHGSLLATSMAGRYRSEFERTLRRGGADRTGSNAIVGACDAHGRRHCASDGFGPALSAMRVGNLVRRSNSRRAISPA